MILLSALFTCNAHVFNTFSSSSSMAIQPSTSYCKTLNLSVPFILRISRAKQNREIKGREYQLQAKIGRNYYIISNCMVLIGQNKGGQNTFAC